MTFIFQSMQHKLVITLEKKMCSLFLMLIFMFYGISFSQTATITPEIHASGLKTVTSTAANFSVEKPDNVVEGDLILFLCSSNRSTDDYSMIPSGAILFHESDPNNTNSRARLYYKIATNNEPSFYDFTVSGNATNRANSITACRVTSYNTANIFGALAEVNSGLIEVIDLQLPSVNLSIPSSLISFTSSRGNISTPFVDVPLQMLNFIGGQPGQISGFLNEVSIGNVGPFYYYWATPRMTVALLVPLNSFTVDCNNVEGSLIDVVSQNAVLGNNVSVTINGTSENIPVGEYVVTYSISGANTAVNQTANVTVTTAGVMVFEIPSGILTNPGESQITINSLNYEPNQCNQIAAVNSNNIASFELFCGEASITTSFVGSAGENHTVYINGNFTPGIYQVTYNLSGANSATNEVAQVNLSGNGGSFVIQSSLIPNLGTTQITVVSISNTLNCPIFINNQNDVTFSLEPLEDNPYSFYGLGNNCGFTGSGCPQTNYDNAFMGSWNEPLTIEYDNFVSSFHSSQVRTANGTFQVWGQTMMSNGTANSFSPIEVNGANFPALQNHQVLKLSVGSSLSMQSIALTTDGLYAWGVQGRVVSNSLTTSTEFQKITPANSNIFGLPQGVNPEDVKMMFASLELLVITTCLGEVFTLVSGSTADHNAARGDGGSGTSLSWSKVMISSGVPLTGIVATRGNGRRGLVALRYDNTLWTWGGGTYLGNNTDSETRYYATMMVNPHPSKAIKMIGTTGHSSGASYFVLTTDGNLYALGLNGSQALGDWTTTERKSWIQPRFLSASGPVMDNIHWISPQEHDNQYASMNVLTKEAKLYSWGSNNGQMIGRGTAASAAPGMPNGISVDDVILSVETGGHTTMITKLCETNFGYVGHRINGSMGSGSTSTATETAFNFNTAQVEICAGGSPELYFVEPDLGINSGFCVGLEYELHASPSGGYFTTTGAVTINGSTVIFNESGSGVITYTVIGLCADTLNLTINYIADDVDLFVNIEASPESGPNESTVVFTVTAGNLNAGIETAAQVNALVPSGFTYVSHVNPTQGTYDPLTGVWSIGTLIQNQLETLEITCTVNPEPANHEFFVEISGIHCESITDNNEANVIYSVICVDPVITEQPIQSVILCENDEIPELNVLAEGYDLSYQWFTSNSNDYNGTMISGENQNAFTPGNLSLGSNYFYVVVTCMDSCEVYSQIVEIILVSVSLTSNSPICEGEDAVFTIVGSLGLYVTFSINNQAPQNLDLTTGSAQIVLDSVTEQIIFDITEISFQGFSTEGCAVSSTLEVLPNPNVSFNADPYEGYPILDVTFENTSNMEQTNFTWNFNGTEVTSNNIFVNHSFSTPGTYNVTLTGERSGCISSDSLQIIVLPFDPPIIDPPNVFSPNNDNTNDFWQFIDLKNVKELELIILNRWGNLVFESDELNPQWNGKLPNGADASEGVYFYKYVMLGLNDVTYEGQGFLNLIRE